MAIVQVSRITNRKGLTENLPQLAGAELGWCIDSRRLFIGNGTLQEGAPIIGNTEILTEFSDILVLSQYTYADTAVGYAAQTGPTPSDPVVRSVQAKLDDFASVRDFGAVGDGIADDTASINRALYQLYCRETNTQVRRSLFFPAGTYRITSSLIIPSYAKLVGEGADCSIILLTAAASYVAQFGDSLQQTGVNIGNNGATPPQNIEISSMSFQTAVTTNVLLVDSATQCYFDSVDFVGPLTTSAITANQAGDDIAGVRFANQGALVCNDITFDKCAFLGLTYAINTNQALKAITVSNGRFATLYQGVVLGEGTAVNGGATGFRVVSGLFDQIYAEGVLYDDVSMNATAYNAFYDVGNHFQGAGNAQTPVVRFGNDNNASINDLFERDDTDANVEPRVSITGGTSSSGTGIQLGRYSRQTGRTIGLSDNVASPTTILTVSNSQTGCFNLDYTITRGTAIRQGRFSVVSNVGSTAVYSEDYNENADVGITLSALQNGNNVLIRYTSTSTGQAADLLVSADYLS